MIHCLTTYYLDREDKFETREGEFDGKRDECRIA